MKHKIIMWRKKCAFAQVFLVGFSLLWRATASGDSLPECMTDSRETPLTFISSASCGTYGLVTTRSNIKVRYMVHEPAGDAKGLVVLFTGGDGNAITQNSDGTLAPSLPPFLQRGRTKLFGPSAQLFAERGYRAVTINRSLVDVGLPEVPEFSGNAAFDQYRMSPAHAIDIAAVLNEVNIDNLPVLFAGTSRGTLSALAQHILSVGISLSSPVTSPSGMNLYIGHPDHSNLQPDSVTVPVRVLAHEFDGCFVTTPQKAVKLYVALKQAGVDSHYNSIDGGFDLAGQTIDGVMIDSCDSVTYHGYLGIENDAIDQITKRFDRILKQLNK